jgi:predicted nuclease of restriction endonuclease-like (RecB) superfamily
MTPREAFREVILNAINHKLYESGNPIQISVYEDKIVVFNQGFWPEDIELEDLYTRKHSSYPHNPNLSRTFFNSGEIEAYGSGFGKRQIERARQFYRLYPIASTLRSQLNWSQYKLLVAISDPDKREYYELESVNNGWTGRETERQINSMLYERLLLSNDKESVLAVARKQRIPESPTEVIKDPMVLEFLGLHRESSYYEKDLEGAIISHITEFLLELGKGFSFVARQKRILLEDDEFFADLVFYNRLLRCFVVIELKTGDLTHQDLGQLQMYVNYYDRYEKLPGENPTIGILLCTKKNDTVVRMTLPEDNKTILASEYKLYLPTTEEFVKEIESVKEMAEKKQKEDEV